MYRLLERVVSLHASIQEFLDQLQRGHFIQCTLDTLFLVSTCCRPCLACSAGFRVPQALKPLVVDRQPLSVQHAQGKQLFCEALALFGAVLLALDRRLQGPVRERLVVAYHRLKGGSQAVGPSANAVIALCASTGLLPARRFSPPGGFPALTPHAETKTPSLNGRVGEMSAERAWCDDPLAVGRVRHAVPKGWRGWCRIP